MRKRLLTYLSVPDHIVCENESTGAYHVEHKVVIFAVFPFIGIYIYYVVKIVLYLGADPSERLLAVPDVKAYLVLKSSLFGSVFSWNPKHFFYSTKVSS